MSSDQLQFRLYVAGEGPNSMAAIANLKALCEKYFPSNAAVEIVDVIKEPTLALQDQVMVTPLLIINTGSTVQKCIGDLSKLQHILETLGIKIEAP